MIGLPFYRVLFATGLTLSGAFVATRAATNEPKDPCEQQQHVYACAIFRGPQAAAAARPGQTKVPAIAAIAKTF